MSANFEKMKKHDDEDVNMVDAKLLNQLKLPPRQPGNMRFKPAMTVKCRSNCHKITFKDTNFYRYESRFFVQNAVKTKDLSEDVKNSVNAESRRHLLNHLFANLRMQHKEIFDEKAKYPFDASCTFFGIAKLNIPSDPIEIDPDTIDSKHRTQLPKKIDKLYVMLKYIGEISLNSASLKTADEQEFRDRSPLQVLELIFNQYINTSDKFHVFPQKAFLKESSTSKYPECQGRIIKDGLSKGVRLCGEDPNKPQLMLQIDVKKGAFFPECTLGDYLVKWYNVRNIDEVKDKLRDNRQVELLRKELKGLTLATTHLKKNKIFRCDGIDDRPARDRTFSVGNTKDESEGPDSKRARTETSVYEYYKQKYKGNYRFSNYPCIIEKTKERNTNNKVLNFYLLDVLTIVGGQRVPIQKMNGDFQESMIKTSCMNPQKLLETAEHLTKHAMLTATNPTAKHFNCPMETDPIEIVADVLNPPALKFANNAQMQFSPDGRLQGPDNRKYLVNGKCQKVLCVPFNRCVRDDQARKFMENLVKFLSERGTRIDKPEYLNSARNPQEIFEHANEIKAKYIFFFMSKNDGDQYHKVMKNMERKNNIVTQHIQSKTVEKNSGDRPQRMTFENIISKTNEKMGGTNYKCASGQGFIRLNQTVDRMAPTLVDTWLGSNRLFIGIDFSNTSAEGSFVTIGVSYNYDDVTHSMTGFPAYAPPRTSIIREIGNLLLRPIMDFKERSKQKKWPSHLIIYRGGISEGEYLQLIAIEKSSIQAFLEDLRKKHGAPPIGFTMITVQRQHKFRVIPATNGGRPPQQQGGRSQSGPPQNIPPGTCITKGITDPTKEQFILMAHKAFQGIPKPAVYTVVADESPTKKRIPQNELVLVTHVLCHSHGSVTSPISCPSYLYWAGQVAKRGSANLGVEMSNDPSIFGLEIEEVNKRLAINIDYKYFS